MAILCKKGHRVITATRHIVEFTPDTEPFEAGVVEDCGFELIDAEVSVTILWCPVCEEVVGAGVDFS